MHSSELGFCPASQHALIASQHDRESANVDVLSEDNILPSSILNRNEDRSAVRGIPQPAFVGSDAPVDGIRVRSIRDTNLDIGVFEPETRIYVRCDFVVRFHDIFYVYIHEIVEGVYMLLNQALDFQESRKE